MVICEVKIKVENRFYLYLKLERDLQSVFLDDISVSVPYTI